MLRIGIVSIPRTPAQENVKSFTEFYGLLGMNTGNLLFIDAAWRIVGDKQRVAYHFIPKEINEKFDLLVIPAANWLHHSFDFSFLADRIEKLSIPVVVMGLGAQAQTTSDDISIPKGSVRFVRAVSEKSDSISVRGAFTAEVLSKMGVKNVTVTGCPSLYSDFCNFDPAKLKRDVIFRLSRCLLHATRYSAEYDLLPKLPEIDRHIFRFAYKHRIDLLYQSEPEEMELLHKGAQAASIGEDRRLKLLDRYEAKNWHSLNKFITKFGRVFYDVERWSDAVRNYSFVFGTRLHGTIMALNSGVPAALIAHDSRTSEVAEFANIPRLDPTVVNVSRQELKSIYQSIDLGAYYARRNQNRFVYKQFLAANNLKLEE